MTPAERTLPAKHRQWEVRTRSQQSPSTGLDHSAIRGDGEAGRVPGGSVLASSQSLQIFFSSVEYAFRQRIDEGMKLFAVIHFRSPAEDF
jgi:hypothetical protein